MHNEPVRVKNPAHFADDTKIPGKKSERSKG
jgi:hypothetical protein